MRKKLEMSDLVLDGLLIDKFRDEVTSNPKFMELCKSLDGKNKLNALYSAMDWIEVAVAGTQNLDIKIGGFGYNHQNTLNLMQYVVLVDLIHESIIQIYRVFGAFNARYPYGKKDTVFKQGISDDRYFKHLRAIFGIHPVNLNSVDGTDGEADKKFFASWVSAGMMHDHDFMVEIYGNSTDSDDSQFVGIDLSDVHNYVQERYLLLNDLIRVPQKFKADHFTKYKGTKIELAADRISSVQILLEENKKRFDSFVGYGSLLNYMLRMFSVDFESHELSFDKSLISTYLEELEKKLPVIKTSLDNMNYQEIKVGIKARGYEFEKIADYFRTHDHEVGEEYFVGLVKYGELPDELLAIKDFGLNSLVYDAYLFSKMQGKKFLIYKDLIKNGVYNSEGMLDLTGYFI